MYLPPEQENLGVSVPMSNGRNMVVFFVFESASPVLSLFLLSRLLTAMILHCNANDNLIVGKLSVGKEHE